MSVTNTEPIHNFEDDIATKDHVASWELIIIVSHHDEMQLSASPGPI